MQLKVLGAAREVGRSAFLIKGNGTNVLLDHGVLMQRETGFPVHIQANEVDAILLSHAHLDHSGATPMFYLKNGPKLYATGLTIELSQLLIEDLLRISGFYLPFEYAELNEMIRKTVKTTPKKKEKIGSFEVEFVDAGHIPGSSSIILEDGTKRILYTGDLNAENTQLLSGANYDLGELDLVISESTYATADHESRTQVESDFVSFAKEIVEQNGTLFVPAFSVGRAQEIACVLNAANFPYPVAMDGMALKTNEILSRYPEYLRDAVELRRAIDHVEVIRNWNQRRKIVNIPGVIISPAGMLVGGTATYYNQAVSQKTKNAISIVAYQVAGTPGRTLLEKGITMIKGKPRKVKAQVRRFDFSSHSGKSDLLTMMKKIKGSPKVIMIHGEEKSCLTFADDIHENLGFETFAPTSGETYDF